MTDPLIDVDGRRLSVRVTGNQDPTVVLLSSSGGGHAQWSDLRTELGATRCVSYGRPGIDGSDPLSADEQRAGDVPSAAARQLGHLLQLLRFAPPYVLVSCSIGGYIADRLLAQQPQDIAGLIQIDPTFISPIPRMVRAGYVDDAHGSGYLFAWDRSQLELELVPPPRPSRSVVVSRAFGTVPAEVIERAWQPLTPAEADEGWRRCQVEWARRLSATHIVASTAGHHVQIDQPRLVAFVVRAVLDAVRRHEVVHLDRSAVHRVGGNLVE